MEREEGFQAYKLLGWKRHGKRSLYGHHFRDGKCLDCGLSREEYDRTTEWVPRLKKRVSNTSNIFAKAK